MRGHPLCGSLLICCHNDARSGCSHISHCHVKLYDAHNLVCHVISVTESCMFIGIFCVLCQVHIIFLDGHPHCPHHRFNCNWFPSLRIYRKHRKYFFFLWLIFKLCGLFLSFLVYVQGHCVIRVIPFTYLFCLSNLIQSLLMVSLSKS